VKKLISVLTITSILILSISTLAFAAEKNTTPQWFKDMITWKKAQINQGIKNGSLTQEQADALNDHLIYMEKWHSENGFAPGMMGRFRGNLNSRVNSGFNCGFGPGMMQDFNNQIR
jgi:hypothetical protein